MGTEKAQHPFLGTRWLSLTLSWGWLNLKHEHPAVAGTSLWPSPSELQGRVGPLNLISMENLHDTRRGPDPSFTLCARCACALCSGRCPHPLATALPCFLLFMRTSSCLERACFKVKCKYCLFWDDSPATPRENLLPSLLHQYLAPPLVIGLLTLP